MGTTRKTMPVPSQRQAVLGAVISNLITWGAVGVLCSQSYGQEPDSVLHPALTHEQILVTLPVFVTSIIATAIFTWTIAQYDRKRDTRIDHTQRMLEEVTKRLTNLETRGE